MAGTETTAGVLAALLVFLHTNPTTLATLQREVRSAFPASATIDDTTAPLPYLTACITEALRLQPPSAFGLPRTSPGALIAGRFVPLGATVHAQPWVLHHDARRWRAPYAFVPERWLPGHAAGQGDDRDAFRPFLDGPRQCLGRNLAWLEMRVVLAKLVWHFDMRVEVEDGEKWLRECRLFTVWHKPPVRVRVRRVDGKLGDTSA